MDFILEGKPGYYELSTPVIIGIGVIIAVLLLLSLILIVILFLKGRKMRNNDQDPKHGVLNSEQGQLDQSNTNRTPTKVHTGKVYQIGKRKYQQDSIGMTHLQGGLLAVIADGMGGLDDGDKVSQIIVKTILQDATNRSARSLSGKLSQMLSHVNSEVNRILGSSEDYVSGSTMIAILAESQQFQWIAVGDSRIYLFRNGVLLQLNREHIYRMELLHEAVNGNISFQEAVNHPKGKSLTSFVGMGKLKYIDEPSRPIQVVSGDRILICSDGIFNFLSDEEIAAIIEKNPQASDAASELETAVLKKDHPKQDNFSAILIGYD